MSEELGTEVLRFLRERIDSVEQLEALARLIDQPERAWTAAELARELRSSESSLRARLEALKAAGALVREASGAYRYEPTRPETESILRALVAVYRLRPYRVIEILYGGADAAMQSFLDAFQLKKEP